MFAADLQTTRRAARLSLALGLVLGLVLTGCTSATHPLLQTEVRERARIIELTRLEDRSLSSPLPPEQARDQALPEPGERDPAPVELRLSVAEARNYALENNLDIRVQLVSPALARERYGEAQARFESSFFARVAQERQEPPDTATASAINSQLTDGELGIRVPLSNGAIATFSLAGSDLDLESGAGDAYSNSASLSVSQPLLRGAGRDANTAPITIARLQQGQQEARTKLVVMRVMADVERAYWRHYAATRILEIRYLQYQRAREQLRQAERLAQSGVIPRIEIVRARAGVSRRVDDIIRAETGRRIGERALKRLMNVDGMGVGSETVLLAASDPNPLGLDFDVANLAEQAVAARMEMLDLEIQLAVDALNLDVARNDERPLLSIEYSLNYLGNESSLADTLDEAFRGDRSGWRVGATLEVPLGNESAEARRRQAILQRALTLRTQAQRRAVIRQEVFDATDLLREAWRRILAAREETLLAGRTFEAENRQFLAGIRTSTDVLEAADFLAEAQIREVNALAEYEIARVGVAFATGTVLGDGRVRLLPHDSEDFGSDQPYRLDYSAAESLPASIVARAAAVVDGARDRYSPSRLGDDSGASPEFRSTDRALPDQGYTIQLVTVSDESTARSYVDRNGLEGAAIVRPVRGAAGPRYVVLLGRYVDRDSAADALAELPAGLRADGAFVRNDSFPNP